ncbi:YutD family protein [Lacticaseibacillus kribbianus]|uniref:YutD family protein n=1 Tax=Lacticaseibacillus kribbianus TaxID=2926292 RepID=UPI001CD5B22A|nr:YutD family protein [Lacticaseibacillus kribbianus]
MTEQEAVNPDEEQAMRVVQVAPDMVTIDGRRYAIALDHTSAFDREKFAARYTDILDKYDYIVGDWGYDQLRLRGFYNDDNRRANKDQLIHNLQDYLLEYCNFGCAYFVLSRLDAPDKPAKKRPRSRGPRRRTDARRDDPQPATARGAASGPAPKRQEGRPTNGRRDDAKAAGSRTGGRRGGNRRDAARKPYTETRSKQAQVTGGKAETVAPNQPRKRHFTIHTRETNEK